MAARNRLDELKETESQVMVSACGNCAHHLGKHTRTPATVVDLIDILAPSIVVGTANVVVHERVE
jgi:Fe-S oxidoreductase